MALTTCGRSMLRVLKRDELLLQRNVSLNGERQSNCRCSESSGEWKEFKRTECREACLLECLSQPERMEVRS